jgi:hypothetical protein
MGGWKNITNKTTKDSKDAMKAKAIVETPYWGVSTREPLNGAEK